MAEMQTVGLETEWPKTPTYALWALRTEIALGRREPAEVPHRLLSESVYPVVERVYDGFINLLRCRWTQPEWQGKPAPYTYDFAAEWCGSLEPWQARAAIKNLERLGAMVEAGTYRRAKLWLPGE
jgi:hypothetical protein